MRKLSAAGRWQNSHQTLPCKQRHIPNRMLLYFWSETPGKALAFLSPLGLSIQTSTTDSDPQPDTTDRTRPTGHYCDLNINGTFCQYIKLTHSLYRKQWNNQPTYSFHFYRKRYQQYVTCSLNTAQVLQSKCYLKKGTV